jgi:hypothetical protein
MFTKAKKNQKKQEETSLGHHYGGKRMKNT